MYRSIELDGYVIDFRCHKDNPKRPKDWDVSLKLISFWDFPFEASILVDHVYPYTFFIGRYSKGLFISIPSLYVSAGVGWMDDPDYISAELREAKLPVMLVISFTEALRTINSILTGERNRAIRKAIDPEWGEKHKNDIYLP